MPAWTTQEGSGHVGLHSETLSQEEEEAETVNTRILEPTLCDYNPKI